MAELGKHLVDPALWPLVDAFPPIDVTAATLADFRGVMAQLSAVPDPSTHVDVHIEPVMIPGGMSLAPVRALLLTPAAGALRGALLHIHSGGFVMGSPAMDVPRNIALVRACGCAVLSVDYRLAPEHPHPAALQDCRAALTWLVERLRSLGSAATPIGIIGESAGGGIAAALATQVQEQGAMPLACQVLIYPMLVPPAQSLDAAKPDPRTGNLIWTRTSNAFAWNAYLAGGAAPRIVTAGLPPTFVAVGDLDLFVHDNLAHVGALLAAGCPVEAHIYSGAVHGFDRMVDAPVSQRYTRELVEFIRRHLA